MKKFTDIAIDENILKSLSDLGFREPTPVQARVIPLMLERQVDLVSLAQTGTGKTAAFGLPLIQLMNTATKQTQGLVLCPTRELCVQVTRDLAAFSRHVENMRLLAVYGGASIEQQIKALRKGVQIIVATPGRLNDLINRGKVDISGVRYVVFDEADEMLQMGFQDELNAILARTPPQKNTLLFSATMSREVSAIAGKYMNDPVEVTVGARNAGADNVRHEYYSVRAGNRYSALKRIVDNCPGMYSIIFCRTRQETSEVAARLIQDGYSADALHGELSQGQRDQVMKKFRTRNLQFLVATDVAARGLDVDDLTHVINYNLPDDHSGYTHRSGRTGRAGRAGISVSIIQPKEHFKIKRIEKKIKKKFQQCRVPSGEEICQKQAGSLAEAMAAVEVNHDRIGPLYAAIAEQLESLDREELIKRFMSLEFKRLLKYYSNASDINAPDEGNSRSDKTVRRSGKPAGKADQGRQFTRFLLNVGRRDGILPQGLIGKINSVPGAGRIKVGRIDIKRNTASLEADSRYVPQIIDAFQYKKINGRTISIEVDQGTHGTGRHHRKGRKGKSA